MGAFFLFRVGPLPLTYHSLAVWTLYYLLLANLSRTQYICKELLTRPSTMPQRKFETVSIRTTPDIKRLLRIAAERERRSLASMMEILILDYARQHDLMGAEATEGKEQKRRNNKKKAAGAQ